MSKVSLNGNAIAIKASPESFRCFGDSETNQHPKQTPAHD
jgi:hypothetical protein